MKSDKKVTEKEAKETKKVVKSTSKKSKTEKVIKTPKKVDHSAIYDRLKTYSAEEALEIVKKLTRTKFDASVEIHVRLGINAKKGDQQVRGAVSLPHGTGKTVRIAAFISPENEAAVKKAGADLVGGEDLINEIKKTEKTDFQVAIAEPLLMKNLGMIAKILGTRSLMPSPKNDTVTTNPVKTVEELKRGKISFKNDDTANIHTIIGKVSFDTKKLLDNYQILIDTIKKSKPASSKGSYLKNISLSSSMSPGVKVIVS